MVTNREALIVAFLEESGLSHCKRDKIPGDASFRCYERITHNGKKLILMDAPPPQEDVRPFVKIDAYLRSLSLSAPEIIASDEENGFLLLEDFGNDSFTKILNGNSSLSSQYNEESLYKNAIDALIRLQKATHFPDELAPYNEPILKREILLFIDWYLPFIGLYNKGSIDILREEFLEIWATLYPRTYAQKPVTVYRDFHADNLMWINENSGIAAVGLLDFQDALLGSPAYDLVSLLEDARRDVSAKTQSKMLDYFIEQSDIIDVEAFKTTYAVLGAQRNSKIIGIFCRLAIRDKKSRYLSYLPRVWNHLENDLSHPALAELKTWIDRIAPKDKRLPESIVIPKEVAASA